MAKRECFLAKFMGKKKSCKIFFAFLAWLVLTWKEVSFVWDFLFFLFWISFYKNFFSLTPLSSKPFSLLSLKKKLYLFFVLKNFPGRFSIWSKSNSFYPIKIIKRRTKNKRQKNFWRKGRKKKIAIW